LELKTAKAQIHHRFIFADVPQKVFSVIRWQIF